ncbi:MAG TPA: UDP-N-acetylglucosamine diphosphorylase/glucosamine-1-phosphate N-acetyltransferase [Cycloclasticus sp.]|jgi:bifunctional UDP-N-acetylglucosamine pyrophosphorylase/glucosamine-1-phosphate N-acetyltransferase|nr:UDP-N-acetylglucosamine diphosphorylase/glucosamine-1-phosphate N-acetyltransferase [Cycloclasticus sp.]HIL91999.1 UDP-N-acetylglucosamine diphosphorylase/glucosamine-1-phosphate N-acetyltransferase [Cycloclasticus sp.]
MNIKTIILAAGKGTRMKSNKAKVLHQIAGKSMLQLVVESVDDLAGDVIVVYGHDGEQVQQALQGLDITWAEQNEQLGTGHAVQQAMPQVKQDDTVLILYGDVPLIKPDTLKKMISGLDSKTLSLLTVKLSDPSGYGRIVRSNDNICKIVEQKDATKEEQLINEVNTGMMAVNGGLLAGWLSSLKNDNTQNEYYLTDVIEMAVNDGVQVKAFHPEDEYEVQGVNSKSQLNQLERHYQTELAERLMDDGATLADKSRLDVRGNLQLKGLDTFIDINNVFEGDVSLGENVIIGPNCVIKNAVIGSNTVIKANSVLEDCMVGNDCNVGPFARLRPGTKLANGAMVGNFVEVKKSMVGEGSKISHLSYIGDAEIGKGVNIGAGTITCNYDGVNKFKTVIEDGAFIGSGTQLVAPVTVGKNATLGAGTTLSKDAPGDTLTVTRAKQLTLKSWKKPTKE